MPCWPRGMGSGRSPGNCTWAVTPSAGTPARQSSNSYRTGNQEEELKKAVLGVFVVLAAVLAGAPLAGVGTTETVACCGQITK